LQRFSVKNMLETRCWIAFMIPSNKNVIQYDGAHVA